MSITSSSDAPESKRQKLSTPRTRTSITHVCEAIKNQINSKKNINTEDVLELCLSPLVQSIPFRRIADTPLTHSNNEEMPVVPRAYEERYMRGPMNSGERPCIMGECCECQLIDRARPFTGVQFPIPNMSSNDHGMCILCCRKVTQLLYHKTLKQGMTGNFVIQKYGNISGVPGEYHPSAMLICPPHGPVHTMPLPIVAHQRNRYSVVESNGIMFIRQHGVYMEDF